MLNAAPNNFPEINERTPHHLISSTHGRTKSTEQLCILLRAFVKMAGNSGRPRPGIIENWDLRARGIHRLKHYLYGVDWSSAGFWILWFTTRPDLLSPHAAQLLILLVNWFWIINVGSHICWRELCSDSVFTLLLGWFVLCSLLHELHSACSPVLYELVMLICLIIGL